MRVIQHFKVFGMGMPSYGSQFCLGMKGFSCASILSNFLTLIIALSKAFFLTFKVQLSNFDSNQVQFGSCLKTCSSSVILRVFSLHEICFDFTKWTSLLNVQVQVVRSKLLPGGCLHPEKFKRESEAAQRHIHPK